MILEHTDLSRRKASLRRARARRSRDDLGTDSVPSKLPPLYVPVSLSPVSRETRCDLWRSIDPSTMVVFKLLTSPSVRKYNDHFNLHVQGKNTFISQTYVRHTDERAETGVSEERGRRKTAELHTSGAKRAEPCRRGVK